MGGGETNEGMPCRIEFKSHKFYLVSKERFVYKISKTDWAVFNTPKNGALVTPFKGIR